VSFSSSLLIVGICGAERDGETIVTFDDWDGDCDAVGDGDRDGGGLTLACLTLGLSLLGYFNDSFLCLPCGGLFQNVWAPNSLSVFMLFDCSFCSLCSSLFLVHFEIVTYRW
jgi:hypothetical protein